MAPDTSKSGFSGPDQPQESISVQLVAQKGNAQAFTLIEMIGVLAVIAILASLITPRVFDVIARGGVMATVGTHNTLKVASTDYLARNGSFPIRAGTGNTNAPVANGRFDADLVQQSFIDAFADSPLAGPAGAGCGGAPPALTTRPHVRSLAALASGTVAALGPATGGSNYNLDGDTSTADFATTETIVTFFVPKVLLGKAIELNQAIDGVENTGTGTDLLGRCMYSAMAADGTVSVYLYVTHR